MKSIVKKLSELKTGEHGEVQEYKSETAEALRLQEMGLLPETLVTMIRKGSVGHPIEIEARGYHLVLRQEDSDLVCLKT